jgi:hypothetical protein
MKNLLLTFCLSILLLVPSPAQAEDPDADEDGYPASIDCDDLDETRNHGIDEELCDGKDNNCDGVVDLFESDEDGDGWAACEGDCDDRAPTEDDPIGGAAQNPGAAELPNQLDDDCDGFIDEGTAYDDKDGDDYPEWLPGAPGEDDALLDCDDADAQINPGEFDSDLEPDGVNNDCDEYIDEGYADLDLDSDGYSPLEGDCDDSSALVYPGAEEVAGSVDMDCDGELTVVFGHSCSTSPTLPGLWGVTLTAMMLLRRRRALALGLFVLPVNAWAQSADVDRWTTLDPDDPCAPMVAPVGSKVPIGEQSAQARARFLGGLDSAFRQQDALLAEAAGVLDEAWQHQVAIAPLDAEIRSLQGQREALLARAAVSPPGREPIAETEVARPAAAQPEAPTISEAKQEDLTRLRQSVADAHVALGVQMSHFTSFWVDEPGALMWAEAQAAVARGDLALAESLMNNWPKDAWPVTAAPTNITNLFDAIEALGVEIAHLTSLECQCGREQAAPFAAAPPEVAEAPRPQGSAVNLASDEPSRLTLDEVQARLTVLETRRRALGTSPLPVAGAVEQRALFDQLVRDFLMAPFRLDSARWTELWWRHGLSALLAGDLEGARGSFAQAVAVSSEPLPYESLPPSFAYSLQRDVAQISRSLRGGLVISVSPTANVLVNGRPYPTTFGELELSLPEGLHLVVILEQGVGRTYTAVHEVRSGRDLPITWGAGAYPLVTEARAMGELPAGASKELLPPQLHAERSWQLQLGARAFTTLYAIGGGGALGVTHTLNHRVAWLDGAGFRLSAPVLRTETHEEQGLVALSAGVGWAGTSRSMDWSVGAGGYTHVGYATGPLLRATVGGGRGPWGVELDARLGWDVSPHDSIVPRLTLGSGVSVTWDPEAASGSIALSSAQGAY